MPTAKNLWWKKWASAQYLRMKSHWNVANEKKSLKYTSLAFNWHQYVYKRYVIHLDLLHEMTKDEMCGGESRKNTTKDSIQCKRISPSFVCNFFSSRVWVHRCRSLINISNRIGWRSQRMRFELSHWEWHKSVAYTQCTLQQNCKHFYGFFYIHIFSP